MIPFLCLVIGFTLGMACAIAVVTEAGYDWGEIMHSWYLQLVYLRYRAEIDEEIDRDVERANELGASWIKR